MGKPDIFLSYNREDQAVAKRFADAFATEGLDVWWDQTLRSGEAYDEVTEAALRGAKAVVVLWSPRSVVSRWVRAEATLADRNKTLVPAMIEPCERPIMFELTQTAELQHWQGDGKDKAWLSFLNDVRRFVERGSSVQAKPAAESVYARAEEPPSLAILPFANRSGKDDDELFADGMVEDLIAALSTIGEVRVLAASATRAYRGSSIDVRQIGTELGVRYLLEGNVRRVGENLRVTAQLVEAQDGAIVWTQRFDRPLTDLAELQEDLVLEVAGHLDVQVLRKEIERALAKPSDISAWELLARSSVFSATQTPENIRKALIDTRKATELAPNYGLARAFRGLTAALHFWQVPGSDDQALQSEARNNAELAIQLDGGNPRVLVNAAMALCLAGAWKEGLRAAERAFEINPHLETGRQAMAMVCIYFRRTAEALEHLEACIKLAPGAQGSHVRYVQMAGAHFMEGRFFKAIQCCEQCLALMPGFIFALKDMAIYLEKLGQRDDALEAMKTLRTKAPTLTLADFGRMHQRSLLPPEVADDLQQTLETLWRAAEEAA